MTLELIVQILTLSLIILVPFAIWRDTPSKWAVIGCVLYAASYFVSNLWQIAPMLLDPPHAYGFALRLYQLGTLLLVAMYAGMLFYAVASGIKPDNQAILVWLVLLVAEGFAVLEYLGCKVFTDPFAKTDIPLAQTWAIEGSKYACGRLHGWLAPYMPPIITSIYVLFIVWRRR